MYHAVIMAGGRGERFWPESRMSRPKQFLSFIGNETMIQSTVRRINKLIPGHNINIVTNEMYRGLVKEQIPLLNNENIFIEPIAKNTAACIGLACAYISSKDDNGYMVVLPSDHLIKDDARFIEVVKEGLKKAGEGNNLITLGIKPNYPETGYGYIKYRRLSHDTSYNVECFVEKPDVEKARQYLEQGNYLWNSGMFIWKVESIMDSFKKYMPMLYESILRIKNAIGSDNEDKVIKEEFIKLDSISIDYGVMEKAQNIYVIPCDFGWDDVGSWTSLERLNSQDEEGNIVKGNAVCIETCRCIVKANKKLVATIGVEDLIIVDTDDAILICKKDRAQDIKKIINEMKESSMDVYL